MTLGRTPLAPNGSPPYPRGAHLFGKKKKAVFYDATFQNKTKLINYSFPYHL